MSFVRFLDQEHGATKLNKLMENYQDGLSCEQGMDSTLGISLKQLESYWQQEVLGINKTQLILQNLAPFLLLTIVLLFPSSILSISSYQSRRKDKAYEF